MIKDDFIKMTLPQRMEQVWDYGELISEKAYYEYNISLFLTGSFYVEVFFHRSRNEVINIEIQDSTQILYAYIKDIDLGELVKGEE